MRHLVRALIAVLSFSALPLVSQAALFVGVSVGVAPPVLPVYVQPPCPTAGYIWMPGYWAWDQGYFWVPGTWVLAPAPGLLWTPGYWGWADGAYLWHAGYWGPHVGFYGGINYGFGYSGVGYAGGYWHGREFFYNRSVTNIDTTNITNVYNRTVINNVSATRVSFNGGAGGVVARPTPAELSAEHEHHLAATAVQRQQEQLAHANPQLRAAANGGRPPIAATARAGSFTGKGVIAAREAGHTTPPLAARAAEHPGSAPRATEERPMSHAAENAARPAGHTGPQHETRPAPQYQLHGQPQSERRAEPPHQGRPAPQSAGHAGQQAARPEHGGEHNRQG